MVEFKYFWYHFLTKTFGEATFYGTKDQFVSKINEWNRVDAPDGMDWKYWY